MSQKVKKEQRLPASRRASKVEEVLDHGLVGTLAYQGGELTGFSMKVGNVDYLLTLRAYFPAGHKVSHVGAANMTEVILKAERLAAEGRLDWSRDKYRDE